jgi:hypothetical protein
MGASFDQAKEAEVDQNCPRMHISCLDDHIDCIEGVSRHTKIHASASRKQAVDRTVNQTYLDPSNFTRLASGSRLCVSFPNPVSFGV